MFIGVIFKGTAKMVASWCGGREKSGNGLKGIDGKCREF